MSQPNNNLLATQNEIEAEQAWVDLMLDHDEFVLEVDPEEIWGSVGDSEWGDSNDEEDPEDEEDSDNEDESPSGPREFQPCRSPSPTPSSTSSVSSTDSSPPSPPSLASILSYTLYLAEFDPPAPLATPTTALLMQLLALRIRERDGPRREEPAVSEFDESAESDDSSESHEWN